MLTDENRVAHLERAALDQQRRARAQPLLEFGLDDVPVRAAVRVRLQLQDFRLDENVLQKRIDTLARHARNRAADDVAAPILGGEAAFLKLLFDAVHVRRGLVALRDRHENLHARLAGHLDALLRLRHDAVVRGDNQDGDIRNPRAARPHGTERGMAGRVEEGDLLARDVDLVRADLLGDAAGLALRHVLLADIVHERRLAVVDMPEEGHDRRARLQRLRRIFGDQIVRVDRLQHRPRRGVFVARMLDCDLVAVFRGDLRRDVRLHALVYGRQDLERHEIRDQPVGLHVQLRRQILHDDGPADGNLLGFGVDGNAAAGRRLGRGVRRGMVRRDLVERLLALASLLALLRAALVVLVIHRLGRTHLGLRGDRDLHDARRRLLQRLEPGVGARRQAYANLGLFAWVDADRGQFRLGLLGIDADRRQNRLGRGSRGGFCRGRRRRGGSRLRSHWLGFLDHRHGLRGSGNLGLGGLRSGFRRHRRLHGFRSGLLLGREPHAVRRTRRVRRFRGFDMPHKRGVFGFPVFRAQFRRASRFPGAPCHSRARTLIGNGFAHGREIARFYRADRARHVDSARSRRPQDVRTRNVRFFRQFVYSHRKSFRF